jgi:cytochrome c
MSTSPLKLYAALLGLLTLLSMVIGFNIAFWGLHRQPTLPVWHVPGASSERGRVLIREHACGACHVVPGVRGAVGMVGPRLDRVKERIYVGGVLPNTPQNLTFWISNPKEADPRTAMPGLGVSEEDARHIAAYLYRLP